MKTLLLPGGLGYIGSHTIVEILNNYKMKIVVVDDYSNCQNDIVDRIFQILKPQQSSEIIVRKGNILDLNRLDEIFEEQRKQGTPIEGIIHFAAKKNATQSVQEPLLYYENNVVGSLNLLKMMEKHKECKQFLFSSTAAVYGQQDNCSESFDCIPISPYGQSKLCVEMMIKSFAKVHPQSKFISLRYFNPAGSHPSGKLGDWPSNYPGNLFPVLQQFIIGKRNELKVFGNDYGTVDGSGVRDYIHITDLAQGHIAALDYFEKLVDTNYEVFNLGGGQGYSVFEVIKTFEKYLGKKLDYQIAPRRPGDMARLVAKADKALKYLNWQTKKDLDDICTSCIKFIRETLEKVPKL